MKIVKRGQKRTKNAKKRDSAYLGRRKAIYAQWRAEESKDLADAYLVPWNEAETRHFIRHIQAEHRRRLEDDCIEP